MKLSKKEIRYGIIGIVMGALLIVLINSLIFKSTHQHISTPTEQDEEITYTCSMHPQIRQNEPGKCPLCGMDLTPLTHSSSSGSGSPFVYNMSPEAVALANVQTQKVKSVSPEHEINLTGRVAVNEQNLAVITANYSGRIERLFVNFTGQQVQKGQRLATIYSPELVTAQSELIEASRFKDVNPVLYNAAREKLRLWKITDAQINDIVNKSEVVTELDVYADQSGIVIRRDIANGDFVNRGTVLFEIADLSNVWILLDAYESDLAFMRVGQKITFTTSSVPGREFTSTISFIEPLINPQTRTAAVRAEINNPQQLLKPEMFVRGKIKAGLSVNEKSLVIPNTSLLWTGRRSIVYIKVPNTEQPAFEMREITLGASLGDYYIVAGGLSEGEEIVTNGVFAIDGAAQLSGNYSMMNRPVDKSIAVPEKFIGQFTDFINHYFMLQNSLVATDFQQSQANAQQLKSALDKIDSKQLDKEAAEGWSKHRADLKKHLNQIVNSKDIEVQREHFSPFSDAVIEAVEVFGVAIESVFVSYCPMAFDDEGAYWLSPVEEINNPYYGSMMLRCGVVEKTIRSRGGQPSGTNRQQGHQH